LSNLPSIFEKQIILDIFLEPYPAALPPADPGLSCTTKITMTLSSDLVRSSSSRQTRIFLSGCRSTVSISSDKATSDLSNKHLYAIDIFLMSTHFFSILRHISILIFL
jgi:hypothetical protein